jgi:dihydrofolate reductase
MSLPLVAIVAVARNGVIGRDNRLLWRLKNDLRRFRALTIGKPIIMGRKTFLSIGKPLPGRHNIVVTRDPDFHVEGVTTVHSIDAALDNAYQAAETMKAAEIIIGGGGELYTALLSRCTKAHVTLVETDVEGDAFFPWPMPEGWLKTGSETHKADPENEFDYSFLDYNRID